MPHEWVSEASSLGCSAGKTFSSINITGTVISRILWVPADRQCAQHNPCYFIAPVINQLFRCNVHFNPIGYCIEPIPLCQSLALRVTSSGHNEDTGIGRGICQAKSFSQ